MNSRYKELFKNMGYLTLSNFASKILVFLLVPVYTSVLSTKEYGSYDAVITTVQFLVPIVIVNITDGVMRFLIDGIDRRQIAKIGYKYILYGITVCVVLCFANAEFYVVGFLNGYEIYALLYAVFFAFNSFYSQYAKGINQVSVMAIGGVIGTFSMLVANIVLLLFLKCGIKGFFIANIIGLAVPTIYYVIRLKSWNSVVRVKDSKISKEDKQNSRLLEKEMLLYSAPLIFNAIGWTINSSLDKYCVIFFYGVAASGILAVAYKIPTILSVLYSIFTQAWQISAITEYGSDSRVKFYSDTFLFVNAVGAVCSAGMILINKPLAHILFANDFYQAWKYVPFLMLSVMFNQTAGFIGPILSAKKESNAMAKAAVIGSVVNLILNVVLLNVMGLIGAAVATAISSFIIYFVRWWYARDLLEKRIYPTIYITWALLLFDAIAESVGIMYIAQILIFIMIIIINLNQIKKVWRVVADRH